MLWCCCGQAGVIQCDSYISGYDDEFTTLQESTGDGGWLYSVPVGLTPTIQPVGTLLLNYDPVMVGTPITFVRCAQWNSGITTMRYEMVGTWQSIGYEEADGVMTGAAVNTTFTNGATNTTVTAEHRLRWDVTTGWRHQVVMFPNAANEFAVLVGTPVQTVRTPAPVGPFAFSLAMELAKQPAGNWTATAFWYGTTAVQAQPLTTPTSSEAEFNHGFSLGFSVVRATIDRWRYQVTR